jgi:hypothetical protein
MCILTNQYSQFAAIRQLSLCHLSMDHGENYISRVRMRRRRRREKEKRNKTQYTH